MLVSVITFEIHDFNTSVSESFTMENTVENQEKVFGHRYTRNISFDKCFDFEFKRTEHVPVEFIDMGVWIALLPEIEAAMTIGEEN
jgi:hypothetical protein